MSLTPAHLAAIAAYQKDPSPENGGIRIGYMTIAEIAAFAATIKSQRHQDDSQPTQRVSEAYREPVSHSQKCNECPLVPYCESR